MSYKAKIIYVLENDVENTIEEIERELNIEMGDVFIASFDDFDKENKHYYVKYAMNNGEVYLRDNTNGGIIQTHSMVTSELGRYQNWFVFCTENEEEVTGDVLVEIEDIVGEIFLGIKYSNLVTKGSEYVNSITIQQGCVSESFASYGSTYSPTISCEMFPCEFTDALISGEYAYNYQWLGNYTEIIALTTIRGHEEDPIVIGRFLLDKEPEYNGETVSFTGSGFMSQILDKMEVDIKSFNEIHKKELEKKYVENGKMDYIPTTSDVYYWEYLAKDFFDSTGFPLYIEDLSDLLNTIREYRMQQLMIPVIENVTYNENNSAYEDIEYNSKITWRELLSGVSILLRGNVIEKNGVFYIKKMPEIQQEGNFRPFFDASMYGSSAVFGNNPMCPSKISVKANRCSPYVKRTGNEIRPVGFGYNYGENTVVINDLKSDIANVQYYPVTIECPWILIETMFVDVLRNANLLAITGNMEFMNWRDGCKLRNRAFVYDKARFETMSWHPLMNVGDMILVEDYDGKKRNVFIGEMTLNFDGSIYTEITSPCDVEKDNVSSSGGYSSTSYSSNENANQQGAQSAYENNYKVDTELNEDSQNAISNMAVSIPIHDILGVNNDYGDRNGHNIIIGGTNNKISADSSFSLVSGNGNNIENANSSVCFGSQNKFQGEKSFNYSILSGSANKIIDSDIFSSTFLSQNTEIKESVIRSSLFCGYENSVLNVSSIIASYILGNNNTIDRTRIYDGSLIGGSLNAIKNSDIEMAIIESRNTKFGTDDESCGIAGLLACLIDSSVNGTIYRSVLFGVGNSISDVTDSIIFCSESTINGAYNSLICGNGLINNDSCKILLGKYNKVEDGMFLCIGNGSDGNRKNLQVMDQNGNTVFLGDVKSEKAGISMSGIVDKMTEITKSIDSQGSDITSQCIITADGGDITITVPISMMNETVTYGPIASNGYVGTIGWNGMPIFFCAIICGTGGPSNGSSPSNIASYAESWGTEYKCETTVNVGSNTGTIIIHTGKDSVTITESNTKVVMSKGNATDFYSAYAIRRETVDIDFSRYFAE